MKNKSQCLIVIKKPFLKIVE
jgi:hypothetical protein